jgi:hypothetical protein
MPNTRIAHNSLVINLTGTDANIPRGTISATGNITGGNLNTVGQVVVTGNITGGNLRATGLVSATGTITAPTATITGTITGGNLAVGSGFISGGNIISAGPISAGGAITAPSLNITGGLTLPSVSTTGNVTGGNLQTAGSISATGTITGGNVSAISIVSAPTVNGTNFSATGNIRGGYFIGNGSQLTDINGPAFIATITSGQGLPTSPSSISQFALRFNAVSQNINNGYNSSTGIFTAPKAGFYQVSAACAVLPTNIGQAINYYGQAVLGIYKNNIPVAAGNFVDARGAIIGGAVFGAFSASSVSSLIYLSVGNTLQCKLGYVTNAPTNFWNTYANIIPNYFQACWLRS